MKIVVFTDLDSTLLDRETYEWQPAQQALKALRKRGGGLVLVSSKTETEMLPLHRELGFDDPFIVENGGGIVLTDKAPSAFVDSLQARLGRPVVRSERLIFTLGTRYVELIAALEAIESEIGCQLRGFSSMSCAELSLLTGLSEQDAANALVREFDEPFLVPEGFAGLEEVIHEAAERLGLTAVQGGRFWHLIGHKGKGRAVEKLIESYVKLFSDVITVGMGDSPNDFPFLEVVDIPVLLGAPDVPLALAGIRRNPKAGPEGWNEEVLRFLDEVDRREANNG